MVSPILHQTIWTCCSLGQVAKLFTSGQTLEAQTQSTILPSQSPTAVPQPCPKPPHSLMEQHTGHSMQRLMTVFLCPLQVVHTANLSTRAPPLSRASSMA